MAWKRLFSSSSWWDLALLFTDVFIVLDRDTALRQKSKFLEAYKSQNENNAIRV